MGRHPGKHCLNCSHCLKSEKRNAVSDLERCIVHDDRDGLAELTSNRAPVVQRPSYLDTQPDESLCDLSAQPHAPLEVFSFLIIGIG